MQLVVVSILTVLFGLIFEIFDSFYTACSFGIFTWSILAFIYEMGSDIPIKPFMIILASLQWLVAPIISYIYIPQNPVYTMSVDKFEYLGFALPGTMAYLIGLYMKTPWSKYDKQAITKYISSDEPMSDKTGIRLIYLGIGFEILQTILPSTSFDFVIFILRNIQLIGLFYILKSNNKNKNYWLLGILGKLWFLSIAGGMFHEFILWASFLTMIYFIRIKTRFTRKLALFSSLVFLIFIIQKIKGEFRKETWAWGSDKSLVDKQTVFTNKLTEQFSTNSKVFEEDKFAEDLVRYNQGWIISRLLYYVPYMVDYANGETIQEAILATIFPRIIMPNKVNSGGKKNFEKFTGYRLTHTSMDISPLGESYVNFGRMGGIICIFFVGLFFNIFLSFIYKLSVNNLQLILWIPLLYWQVVKAESDIATGINHLVKTAVIVTFIFSSFGKKYFLPTK